MAKGNHQKLKLLYLAKIFYEETDENHGLTIAEIIARLQPYDVNADRKTLYLDFDELRHFGLDLICEQEGNVYRYKLASREFELPELKLLVDAVQSSKFITEKKSRSLIRKLESLVSVHNARQLQRQVFITGRVKTMNESIYYNVDQLHTAIHQNCQIQFHYFQWNAEKQAELRRQGAWYHTSPWYLRWDDENYYLIGYDAEAQMIKHYRVDKMKSISLLDLPREGKAAMEQIDPTAYAKSLFGMYGGEVTRVTLEGEDSMTAILIDRFGKDIPIQRIRAGQIRTWVEVTVSPQFLGWVASLCGKLRIASPDWVIEEMRRLLQTLSAQYEG